MSVSTNGDTWTGTDPSDLQEYLKFFASGNTGDGIDEFRLARCSCGSVAFELEADDAEGCALRRCAVCETEHLICDSAEYWEDAEPDQFQCPQCDCEHANVAVGFTLYPEDGEIKWLYVGCRCAKCGALGCFADWKIAYAPSRQLFDLV